MPTALDSFEFLKLPALNLGHCHLPRHLYGLSAPCGCLFFVVFALSELIFNEVTGTVKKHLLQVVGKDKSFAADSIDLGKRVADFFVNELADQANHTYSEKGKTKITSEHLFSVLKVEKEPNRIIPVDSNGRQKKKMDKIEEELRREHEEYLKSGVSRVVFSLKSFLCVLRAF